MKNRKINSCLFIVISALFLISLINVNLLLNSNSSFPPITQITNISTPLNTLAFNGSINLDNEYYSSGQTATVTVIDFDLNIQPLIEEVVEINVSSSIDSIGIYVNCTETGINTSIFVGNFTFGASSNNFLDIIAVSNSSIITVHYYDQENGTGFPVIITDSAIWTESVINSSINLDKDFYYGTATVAMVTVFDIDSNITASSDTLDIRVNSTSSGTEFIFVTLTETNGTSANFTGTFTFSMLASSNASDIIIALDGDIITTSYNNLIDTAIWIETYTGIIALNATEYYGISTTAAITVVDADLNSIPTLIDSVYVMVNSSSDIVGINVLLTETGVNTGIFVGTFKFNMTSSNDPTDSIFVQNGDIVAAIYNDTHTATGLPALPRDFAIWHALGTINLDADYYYGKSTIAVITVFDSDFNINPLIKETVNVSVNSSSDIIGINVTLTETGVNTSIFQGYFAFNTSASNDTIDVIWVQDGDIIMAIHNTSKDTAIWWNKTTTGTIELDAEVYYGTGSVATITVMDSDLNKTAGVDTLNVNVNSSIDPIGIIVQLTEIGNTTGEFTGTFTFSNIASNDPSDIIWVQDGTIVMVIYNDSQTASGDPAIAKDSATWNTTTPNNGSIFLDDEYYSSGRTAIIRVNDPDLNTMPGAAESVKVNVTSSDDPIGINVTCTETGVNTSIFEGTFTFGGISDDDADIIEVTNGSVITVVYYDEINGSGMPTYVIDTALWTQYVSGTINLNATIYYETTTVAMITVDDYDLNQNPIAFNVINISVTSTFDPIGINVTCNETNVDSGIFMGTFTFSTVASNDLNDVILIQNGSIITVVYNDTNNVHGLFDNIMDMAVWLHNISEANFLDANDYYGLGAVAIITVIDWTLNQNPFINETVNVTVNSSSDVIGINVTLTEIGWNSSIFRGNFTFSNIVSNDSLEIIKIEDGGTVMVTYNNSKDTAIWHSIVTGNLTLDAEFYYGAGTIAAITIDNEDLNQNSTIIENLDVWVNSSSDLIGINVTLTENGVNSSIFMGTFTFNTTASNDALDFILVQDGDVIAAIYNQLKDSAIWYNTSSGPLITLDFPQNNSVLQIPDFINLTITDANLDPSSVEWKANITETNWTNSWFGTYDINLSNFTSDQVVLFWIRANNTMGNQSIATVILTFDDTPPTKPSNPSFVIQPGNITISWSASSDNNTVYYKIWRNGQNLGNTTSNYYSDILNLSHGTYVYIITPVDEANNTGESLIITITILGPFTIPPIFTPSENPMILIIIIIGVVGAGASFSIFKLYKQLYHPSSVEKGQLKIKGKKNKELSTSAAVSEAESIISQYKIYKRLVNENLLDNFDQEIAVLSSAEINRVLKLDIPSTSEKAEILKELASLSPKEREEFLKALEDVEGNF